MQLLQTKEFHQSGLLQKQSQWTEAQECIHILKITLHFHLGKNYKRKTEATAMN